MSHPSGDQTAPYGGQYTGFGMFGQEPKKPRGNRSLWLALGALALVLVVGGIVVTYVLTSKGGHQAGPATSSSAAPATDQVSDSGTDTAARNAGWQVIRNSSAHVSYEVPASWQTNNGSASAGAVRLSGLAEGSPFDCQGRSMVQAVIGSGTSTETNPTVLATSTAQAFATVGYTVNNSQPQLGDPAVQPVNHDGVTGIAVTVEATPTAVSTCFAPKGQVTAIAVQTSSGLAVVLLDVALGGPHADQGPTPDDVRRIVDSVRVTSGT